MGQTVCSKVKAHLLLMSMKGPICRYFKYYFMVQQLFRILAVNKIDTQSIEIRSAICYIFVIVRFSER